MAYLVALVIAIGFGVPVAVLSGAIGQGKAASAALGWPLAAAILALGFVAVLYTTLGGLVADIWSDVLQLVVLWAGCAASAWHLLASRGDELLAALPPERLVAWAPRATGLGDGETFAFLPMLVGGLFLYLSYYGCDQSQAQRLLAARTTRDAERALVLNGLLRFPLVLTYCGLGLLLAGLLQVDGGFASAMAGRPPDALVPTYLVTALPGGLRGLLVAAILAAAMSSIDSALNSLAAVTLEDVAGITPERQPAWLARATTLAWGLFAVGAGLGAAASGRAILELVNQVGSLFYGPVLGVFLVARLAPRAGGRAALGGLAAGLAATGGVAALATGVSWLWWSPLGCVATLLVGLAAGRDAPALGALIWPRRATLALAAMFVAVLAVLVASGARAQSPPPAPRRVACTVAAVSDGDTLRCRQGDRRVRLLGIDAPEREQAPHGARARAQLLALAPVGRTVWLELDVRARDQYDRVLAWVWRPDSVLVNRELVRRGYAVVSLLPPNLRYERELRTAARDAQRERAGLWATDAFACPPEAFRKGQCG